MYHSLGEAAKGTKALNWLDLDALFRSYLQLFGNTAILERIYYFSAFAEWRKKKDPTVVDRHKTYLAALASKGVVAQMGRFKVKDVWCKNCKTLHTVHEEKETDVAIGAKLLELFITDACDIAVLVCGDTDLVPAVTTAQRLFPKKRVVCGFPFNRTNAELQQLCPGSFKVSAGQYAKYQFPNPVTLPDGTLLQKPAGW
jgi:RNase P subunit RPR2